MGERNFAHFIVALLLHLLLEVDVAVAANCHSAPLHFAASQSPLFQVTLGTPPQQLGLAPSTVSNESYVPSRHTCGRFVRFNLSEANCEAIVGGGVFNQDNSKTYKRIQALHDPDFLGNQIRGTNASLSTDMLTFKMEQRNLALDFQFDLITGGLITDTNDFANVIGLGPGSVLLEALFKAGNIPSKSYSLDLMQRTAVLGGYDAAGLNGTFDTFPLEPSTNNYSYLHVEVADLLVRPSRGAAPVSLMAGRSLFNVSVDTSPWMFLPPDVTTAYMKHTSADFITTSEIPGLQFMDAQAPDMTPLRHSSPFSGDLTVVLSSGLRATIPNEHLINNYTTVTNDTVELSQVWTSNVRPYSLGALLFAGIVLAVDYDQGLFGLAKSNHNMTEARQQAVGRKIVVLGCDGGRLGPQPKKVLSTGAIAGIACGVVGALLLLASAWLVWRRLGPGRAGKTTPPPTVNTEIAAKKVVEAPVAENRESFVEMGPGDEPLRIELAG